MVDVGLVHFNPPSVVAKIMPLCEVAKHTNGLGHDMSRIVDLKTLQ